MGSLSQGLKILRCKYGHNNPTFTRGNVRGYSREDLFGTRHLSSAEVFTALKPFFFSVHPDLFGQFPSEREVNENSLKQLNAYIESADNINQRGIASNPTHLTFYLRQQLAKDSNLVTTNEGVKFQTIRVDLGHDHSIRKTVHTILEKCNLPTSYLDSIPAPNNINARTTGENFYAQYDQWTPGGFYSSQSGAGRARSWSQSQTNGQRTRTNSWEGFYGSNDNFSFKDFEKEINEKKLSQDDLEYWLKKNSEKAKKKLQENYPVRQEIIKNRKELCDTLEIKDIIWDCGWSIQHCRGCLESLRSLAKHHPETMKKLKGRTLIFGKETGVSLHGDLILNSSEVRRNWLDMIKNIETHDEIILRIPSTEKALSRALKDIKVVHRKYETNKIAEDYEGAIRKLTTSIGDYKRRNSFPRSWPESLCDLELVVEADAGPLMVSPTGQIIVPSSCPPFLLVNFINENITEARIKLEQFNREKYEEIELQEQCIKELGLSKLEKDDSVSPNYMIDCCKRLIKRSNDLAPLLQGTHLLITNYYSVLSEGDICIPWDFKDSQSQDSSAKSDEQKESRERSYSSSW